MILSNKGITKVLISGGGGGGGLKYILLVKSLHYILLLIHMNCLAANRNSNLLMHHREII